MQPVSLVQIEATGIQDYIFGSNNLAQNIGASENVTQATSLWVFETLDGLHLPHNVSRSAQNTYEIDQDIGTYEVTDRSIEQDELSAEVVYAGGGNALILFAIHSQAVEFIKGLTRRVLIDAPGLQVAAIREPINWEQEVFKDKHRHQRSKLAARKSDRAASAPLIGLGVTAACSFTGLPAVGRDTDGRLSSSIVMSKLAAEPTGLERLHRVLPGVRQAGLEFVYDFDLFGTKGESSYIAVIHTDGNAMGNRIEAIGSHFNQAKDNAGYVKELRGFSRSVNRAAVAALRATVADLMASRNRDPQKRFGGIVPTPHANKKPQLPFRPIVFGGDDVTFVCEGRLGLALATKYLEYFAAQKLSDNKQAHARAGVAVVKSHYPFSRAYDLAEELCASAKQYISRRKRPPFGEDNLTALDWHFAVTGLVRDLPEIRQREYHVPAGNLYLRPYRLSDVDKDRLHSWPTFVSVARDFTTGTDWVDKRNKVKALRDALRGGSQTTQQFLLAYSPHHLPEIVANPELQKQGWTTVDTTMQTAECGYFDAIEAMDFFVAL